MKTPHSNRLERPTDQYPESVAVIEKANVITTSPTSQALKSLSLGCSGLEKCLLTRCEKCKQKTMLSSGIVWERKTNERSSMKSSEFMIPKGCSFLIHHSGRLQLWWSGLINDRVWWWQKVSLFLVGMCFHSRGSTRKKANCWNFYRINSTRTSSLSAIKSNLDNDDDWQLLSLRIPALFHLHNPPEDSRCWLERLFL